METINIFTAFHDVLLYTCVSVCLITLPVLVVGIVFSVLQAATQVNEMTLTFIPKVITMFVVLLFIAPWMFHRLVLLMQYYMENLAYFIR